MIRIVRKSHVLILLTLTLSISAYEFAGNAKLRDDVFAGVKTQNLDIPVTWFIKKNLGKYPSIDATGGPQVNIPAFLEYFDVTNRAMQTASSLASNDLKYNRVYPVYMISMLDCLARIQPDIHVFLQSIPKSDPTYATRVAGFQKMNNGVVTTIISVGLMMGEKRVDDETKVYALTSLRQILPKFKGFLDKPLMSSCLEVFTRYDISDQANEIKEEFQKIKNILGQW